MKSSRRCTPAWLLAALAAGGLSAAAYANDSCATPSTASLGDNAGDLTLLTSDIGDADTCGGTLNTVDEWWSFTAAAAGDYSFNTCTGTTTIDSVISLFSACPTVNGEFQLACNDDSCGLQSDAQLTMAASETVLVRVSEFGSDNNGPYTLNIATIVLPTGACCDAAGGCTGPVTSAACATSGGVYQGDMSDCGTTVCPLGCAGMDCASSTVISTLPFNDSCDNTGNSTTGPGLSCNSQGLTINNSAWWTWTGDGSVVLFTADSVGYDGVIGVYEGTCAGTLTEVFCSDPEPANYEFTSVIGVEYFFVIGDWGTSDGGGATTIFLGPPPTGGCCFSTGTCTIETAASCATAGGTYLGDATDCTGTPCNGACCATDGMCTEGSQESCEIGGGTFQGIGTDCATAVCLTACGGDTCLTANVIATVPFSDICDSTGNTQTAEALSCDNGDGTLDNSVYWTWTGDGTSVLFTADAPDYDAAIGVFEGSCGALTEIFCSDPEPASFQLDSVLGTTYYFVIGDWGTTPGGGTTTIFLGPPPTGACCNGGACTVETAADCATAGGLYQGDDVDCASVDCGIPSNDLCDDALSLAVPGNAMGNTSIASTDEPPASTCGTSISAAGVWYTVTGTGNSITITTCNPGTDYDTKLNVYCGSCADLICVGGNDDGSPSGLSPDPACVVPETGSTANRASTVTWCSELDRTYYVLVQGFGGATGNFELTSADDATPCVPTVDCAPPVGCCCFINGTTDVITEDNCTAQGGSWTAGGDCFGVVCNDQTPSNDDCASAIDLSCFDQPTGSTSAATFDAFEMALPDDCGTSVTTAGVWYKHTGSGLDTEFTTCKAGTDYDTKLHIWESGDGTCDTLVCAGGNDDGAPAECGLESSVTVPTTLGTVYYIYVSGFGTGTGNFELTVNCLLATGACCLDCNVCMDVSAGECTTLGGAYGGDGTDCATGACPTPDATGACCLASGECVETCATDCTAQGGIYAGDGVSCDPTGGFGGDDTAGDWTMNVSDNAGGDVTTWTEWSLDINGGSITGSSTRGDPSVPDADALGVTDVINLAAVDTVTDIQVTVGLSSTWAGDVNVTLTSPGGTTLTVLGRPGVLGGVGAGDSSDLGNGAGGAGLYVFSDSATADIPTTAVPLGAADVIPAGAYRATDSEDVVVSLNADGSDPCTPVGGACCTATLLGCIDVADELGCDIREGVYQGDGSSCDTGIDCGCPCNNNGDTVVDSLDLLAFLSLWFPDQQNNPVPFPGTRSDYNGDGIYSSLDLLAFLACWFPTSTGGLGACP